MSQVSVIVPCYNYAHYLRECIESVLTQTGAEVRVLIIDDASPDNTPEVAATLAAQDPRIEYRRHTTNQGHIATYNEGLAWADGDYTVLLSADDLLTPGSFERATRLMDAHPEVGMVYGGAVSFRSDQPRPQPRLPAGHVSWQIHPGLRWLEIRCRWGLNPICSPEAMVRTNLQKKIGGYRPELPHTGDVEMWMRFAANASVGEILDADQAFYRRHTQNMSKAQYGTYLIGIRYKKAAFDSFFREYGNTFPGWKTLQNLANRSMAREAYWAACWLFDHGTMNPSVSEAVDFAANAYRGGFPDLHYPGSYLGYLRAYMCMHARLLLGPHFWPLVRPIVNRFEVQEWTPFQDAS